MDENAKFQPFTQNCFSPETFPLEKGNVTYLQTILQINSFKRKKLSCTLIQYNTIRVFKTEEESTAYEEKFF